MYDKLTFTIDEWSDDGSRIVEVMARVGNFDVATAAYDAALRVRPNRRLTLRQGALLLRERLPG